MPDNDKAVTVDCAKYELDARLFNFSDPQNMCCTCVHCIATSVSGEYWLLSNEGMECELGMSEFSW
jgi:hypothetical protein